MTVGFPRYIGHQQGHQKSGQIDNQRNDGNHGFAEMLNESTKQSGLDTFIEILKILIININELTAR